MPTEGGPTRRIRVWAPYATSVHLITGSEAGQRQRQRQRQPMVPDPPTDATSGWWSVDVPGLAHGTAYGFSLDDGEPLPDPRSVWLPDGVHALTRHYDHDRFAWEDAGWTGRPLAGSVLYELHVGTFTAEGTFDAAIDHLDHLVDLGVDLVELMPVAAFDGTHGWGYDGVASRTAARTASSASSTPATPAASACCWTSSTTTWVRRATTSTATAPTRRPITRRRGDRR